MSSDDEINGKDDGAPEAGRRVSWRRVALFGVMAAVVVVLDQLTKAAMRSFLAGGEPVTLIPGVLDLSLTYNTGAAFSMGEGAGPVYVLFAAAILVAGIWFAAREEDAPVSLVAIFGCVAGGGVGNAIDRVVFGRVTDFFLPTFIDFAVFNVADIFITCGVIVGFLIYCRWDDGREDDSAEAAGDESAEEDAAAEDAAADPGEKTS